ncbi:hypothetical protein GCM10010103_72140 [Streptomyces paradoxus]
MVRPAPGTPDFRRPCFSDLGPGRRPWGVDPYGRLGSDARRDALDQGRDLRVLPHLSGVVELIPEGGEPVIYKAGDSFVMKPGYVGVWKTIETVRKIYVTVT